MVRNRQSGFSMLMVIVSLLSLVVVGMLGFIYYQNFIQNKPETITTNSNKAELTNFSNEYYSLKYPSDWSIETGIDEIDGPGEGIHYVKVQTSKLVSGGSWVGVSEGASIKISENSTGTTWSEYLVNLNSYISKDIVTNSYDATIDGQTAKGYDWAYEFAPYRMMAFEKNSHLYEVKMTAKYDDFSKYNSDFKQIYESLKVN